MVRVVHQLRRQPLCAGSNLIEKPMACRAELLRQFRPEPADALAGLAGQIAP